MYNFHTFVWKLLLLPLGVWVLTQEWVLTRDTMVATIKVLLLRNNSMNLLVCNQGTCRTVLPPCLGPDQELHDNAVKGSGIPSWKVNNAQGKDFYKHV